MRTYWSFLFSVVILILTIIFFFVFSKFLTYILGVSIKSRNSEMILHSLKYTKFTVFISVFTGPMFEEIVYRKILFGYLYDLLLGCNKYVRFITSALVSSIIFGATHDGVLHPAMIYYVIYGIIFSSVYLYEKNFCIYDSACFKQLIFSYYEYLCNLILIKFLGKL